MQRLQCSRLKVGFSYKEKQIFFGSLNSYTTTGYPNSWSWCEQSNGTHSASTLNVPFKKVFELRIILPARRCAHLKQHPSLDILLLITLLPTSLFGIRLERNEQKDLATLELKIFDCQEPDHSSEDQVKSN